MVALVFLSEMFAVAQVRATKPLIVEKVDENNLIALKGNTPPGAIAANDRGAVNPGMAMTGLILTLRRSQEQQAAFDAFVASQYDPSSANFHHWLEPEQVGEQYGPALQDIAAISSWLSSHGLTVESVSKDRMAIGFSGTAAQVEETFHTEIHNLMVKGEQHISNMSDPQIPIALEPVVLGPKALHNFIPRPLHRLGARVALNKDTGNWQGSATGDAKTTNPRPEMGLNCGTGCLDEDVTPYDFATVYNVLPLWNEATPIDGTGQTIAIAGRSDVRASDVSTFRSAFGLGSSSGTFHVINNGTDPGFCTSTSATALCTLDDQIENALDSEWAGAVAKGAAVDLVVTAQTATNDSIYESANYVIQNNTAKIINVSYGLCELAEGTSGNAAYNTLWQTAASAGISVFAAIGDSGSAGCDQGGDANGTPYLAKYGLSVSGIASSQYDTAVGGTDFNWGSTAAPYWNGSNSSTTGASAVGYIPETPWNDTCTNPISLSYLQGWATTLNKNGYSATSPTDAESACNFVLTWDTTIFQGAGVDISYLVDTVGGGGGPSNCTTNGTTSATLNPATCAGGYPKPSWQSSFGGTPNDNARDVPDVSFFAGNGILGSSYLICVTDWGPCVTSPTATSEPLDTQGNPVNLIGGTSAASPGMSGVMALINQKAGSAQGNPNSELYTLAGKQTYANCSAETVSSSSSCFFNDPNTGTNAMACASGSPNCTISHSGDTAGVLTGFSAGAGFDNATGLGSLNVANVVNAWTGSTTGTATATVTVTPASNSIVSNQSLSVTVAVTGASGTPTGMVTLSSGTYTSSAATLSSGSATITIPANSLSAGTDKLTANYSGDSTYAAASGSANVTVTQPTLLTPTVTVTPASGTISANQSLSVTVGVTGTGATPSGSVTLSGGGYTSSSQTLVSGSATFSIPANSLSVGTDTLTANYSGDANYATGSGSASVTVNAVSQGSPEGAYLGTTSTGKTFETIVLPDNTFYAIYGTTTGNTFTVSGMITGKGSLSNGTLSASITDYYYTGAVYTGTVSATYVAGTSISGTVTDSGIGTLTFTGTAIPSSQFNFNAAASLSQLTGSWTGALLGGTAATASVSGSGSFTGSSQGCSYSGTASPDSSGKNFFDFSITFGAAPCAAANQTLTGIAVEYLLSDGVTHQLLAAFSGAAGGDVFIASSSGSTTSGSFSLGATNPSAINPGGTATSTISVTPSNGYSGSVTLACALTSGPSNQTGDAPVCSPPTAAVSAGSTGTVTVTTTAASTSSLAKPRVGGWAEAGGGAALALLVFFGIPARRRGWRAMLGVVVIMLALGSLGACGGGGGSGGGGGGGNSNPGTAAGSYVFTLTGTGSPAVTPAPTITFTVTVN